MIKNHAHIIDVHLYLEGRIFTVNLLQRHDNDLLSAVRRVAGERGIWQRHFWEHVIRDDLDYQRHVDYIHVDPMKHGYVKRVKDWPYSTFHHYVDQGIYLPNWCGDINISVGNE